MHPNRNNHSDSNYGIPVATPYSRDIEMTDASRSLVHLSRTKVRYSEKQSSNSKSKRSPGKRVVYYQSLVPEVNQVSCKKQKKRIDFTQKLPTELCTLIVSLLDFDTLLVIPNVSRTCASLFYVDDLWKLRMNENNWKLKIPNHVSYLTEEEQSWYYWYKQRFQLESRWNMGKVASHYLIGHLDSVYCLQFDDEKIITGSRDRTIRIWDLKQYQCTDSLEGHQGSVLCLQYNDEVIISGSSDHTVIVWDMRTKRIRGRLHGHSSGVSDISFDHRYIISSSKDASIRIWSSSTFQPIRMIMGHQGPVNAIQLHGDYLVSASSDALIKLWEVSTGNLIREFAGHKHGLACVQFDGKRIVSGSNDHTIRIWDAETGLCTMVLEGHTGLVRNLRFDGNKVVSASYDQSIRVWDVGSGACLLNFQSGHSSWIFDVHFDRKRIVSSSQDRRILVMDFAHELNTKCLDL